MKYLRTISLSLSPAIILLTVGFSLLPCAEAIGQQRQFIFERVQGVFMQPTVYALDADEYGRLWYGTWGRGVFVYDGYGFERYQASATGSNALTNDRVLSLKTDNQQRVWVGTMNGLDCIDRRTGQISHFQAIGDSIFQFMAVYSDKAGQVWAAGAKGILRFDEQSQSFENIPPAVGNHKVARPNCFFEDKQGTFWLGRGDGLLRFSPDHRNYKHIPIAQDNGNTSPFRVISVVDDEQGNFWIAGYEGLMRFDRTTEKYERPLLPDSLAFAQISALLLGPEGKIWVATVGKGLYQWIPATGEVQRFAHNVFDPTSLPSNKVYALLYDKFGNLWAATDRGLARLNLLPQPFSKWLVEPSDPNLASNNILHVIQDSRSGGVLMHTQEGLFYSKEIGKTPTHLFAPKDHPPFFDPDNFVKDRNGNVWAIYDGIYRWDSATHAFTKIPTPLGTDRVLSICQDAEDANVWWLGSLKGLHRFDQHTGEMQDFPDVWPPGQARGFSKIMDDGRGLLWLNPAAALARFDKKTKKTTFFSRKSPAPNQLVSEDVLDIGLAADGWVWATAAGGITQVDPSNGAFRNIVAQGNLPDNLVLSVIFDKNEHAWLVFPEHILRQDRLTGARQIWNTGALFQTGQLVRGGGCSTNDGRLLFPSREGLLVLDPAQMDETRPASAVLLTRFETSGKARNPDTAPEFLKHIPLANDQNSLTIGWAGIQTARPSELRYECKLERKGSSVQWEQKGAERQAVYANLDPGAYIFRVRIAGVESPELRLEIVIAPAWYQTESFKMLLMALFATAAYLFWRNREDNRELVQQKELAEQNARYKTRFLANMSHEIRTPMNAILGLSRLLTESKLPRKQGDYADAIRQSSENLLVIVNDVLDQAKIESGKFKFQHKPFDLELIVRHLQNTLGFKAEEKGLRFGIKIAPETPTQLLGDPVRLNQILTNLLGNAIKFTNKGSVTLDVGQWTLDEKVSSQSVLLYFKITDTGIGIPPEQATRVFESFQQADDDISTNYGGTGLGLSITKDLVEQQGGKIELESEQGRGTTISVTIPFELDHTSASKDQKIEKQAPSFENLRVLLVEDTYFNLMLATELLKSRIPAVDIEVAENGQVALEKIESSAAFDLVLMDVKMPVMDGLEATRRIRAMPEWAKLPIIALTANAVKEELEKCSIAGMDACVTKPIDADELFTTMQQVLNHTAS